MCIHSSLTYIQIPPQYSPVNWRVALRPLSLAQSQMNLALSQGPKFASFLLMHVPTTRLVFYFKYGLRALESLIIPVWIPLYGDKVTPP